jgi:hypothetical protein
MNWQSGCHPNAFALVAPVRKRNIYNKFSGLFNMKLRILVILLICVVFTLLQGCCGSIATSCGDNICEIGESYSSCPQDCKLAEVQRIAEEYHKTHTYSLNDFYVCSNMAMDVWNMIKTQGIDAKICVGNVKENISSYLDERDGVFNYYNHMDHAWVLAEVEPFKYIAVETTGGYLVWGNYSETNPDNVINQLYYTGTCFNTPNQFQNFIDARKDMLTICSEAINMENYWNKNYVGKILTPQASEYKGRLEQKTQECLAVLNEIKGLQSS